MDKPKSICIEAHRRTFCGTKMYSEEFCIDIVLNGLHDLLTSNNDAAITNCVFKLGPNTV